jgi:molybdate transport system substrate-binding protein
MIAVLGLSLLVLMAACTGSNKDELVVFAAASLTDVLTELGEQYRTQTGTDVVFSFGGSQLLSRQILNGAPADLMISAGRQPIDLLQREGVVQAGPFDLVGNVLVVVTRRGFSDPPGDVTDLVSESIGNLSIPDPNLAPAGAYARESLTSLGLWEALADKIVPTGDVRASLTNAERGNTDAAIVYRTDAVSGRDLQILDIIPPDSHSPIVYPAVVTTRSQRPEAALKFAEFLVGEAAGKVFARYGFTPLFNEQVGR